MISRKTIIFFDISQQCEIIFGLRNYSEKFRNGSRFLQIRDNNTKIFTAHLPAAMCAEQDGTFSRTSFFTVNLREKGNSYGIGGVFPYVFLQMRRFPPRRCAEKTHASPRLTVPNHDAAMLRAVFILRIL